jgi:hypothetical protein
VRIGIVGSEQAKFTPLTERAARAFIRRLLTRPGVSAVVSGACHLGGVDSYAREEGEAIGRAVFEFAPAVRSWSDGYKPRNAKIASASDHVVCITVRELPASYEGMRFPLCYHCKVATHVKSGGCWTVNEAIRLGKGGYVYVIEPDGRVVRER